MTGLRSLEDSADTIRNREDELMRLRLYSRALQGVTSKVLCYNFW
jgi:hypothetical protein